MNIVKKEKNEIEKNTKNKTISLISQDYSNEIERKDDEILINFLKKKKEKK